MPSSCGNQRQIICCPRNYWSQLHSLSVGPSTVHPVPPLERLAQGRDAIGAIDCGLPSQSCWMHWVCLPCTKRTTAPTCVVVAKCRDARLRIIFSVRWSPEGLPAAQHCCSEKSSQLQSNMSYMHLSFCDVSYHFMTVSIILQINVFDGGQCTRGKVSLISWVSQGLKKSIWGKASLGATWYQCGLKGAGPKGQDGGMMTASKLWPTTLAPYL